MSTNLCRLIEYVRAAIVIFYVTTIRNQMEPFKSFEFDRHHVKRHIILPLSVVKTWTNTVIKMLILKPRYRAFLCDITAAVLVFQENNFD